MYKIRQYFSTLVLIKGLIISLLGSSFIYLDYLGFSHPFSNTLLGLLGLYFLLQEDRKIWFTTGAFTGFLWFWWISLSLQHYGMLWAIPLELFIIMLSYGVLFWVIAKIASIPVACCTIRTPKVNFSKWCCQRTMPYAISLAIKSLGLLSLSYIHPFSFDWFKPELVFVESYLGIHKWQFAFVLLAILLSILKRQFFYLFFLLFAYEPTTTTPQLSNQDITLVTTHTSVKDKWDKTLHPSQFEKIYATIDKAIENKKKLIVFPESIFPVFINHSQEIIDTLEEKSKYISIVTGGLYWDGKTPRNSAYIFAQGKITVANKVILVPFGESNPLPDFLSDWVNKVFYDGAVDYKASVDVVDYTIADKVYRSAICFEATSEKLYEKEPKNMIVLSNNGWFVPSTEPTLQKLLLQYYSKKYDTTIYHSVNMSKSYIIQDGKVLAY